VLNAIGNITVATFMGLELCDQHMLEEFDNWCAYTRSRIMEQQQGHGATRQ
jgi:hypothetical protein